MYIYLWYIVGVERVNNNNHNTYTLKRWRKYGFTLDSRVHIKYCSNIYPVL